MPIKDEIQLLSGADGQVRHMITLHETGNVGADDGELLRRPILPAGLSSTMVQKHFAGKNAGLLRLCVWIVLGTRLVMLSSSKIFGGRGSGKGYQM